MAVTGSVSAGCAEDEVCLDWLWRRLHSRDGVRAWCPRCRRDRSFYRVRARPSFSCDACGWHLHPTATTLFRRSRTPLHVWFWAVAALRAGLLPTASALATREGIGRTAARRVLATVRDARSDPETATFLADVAAAAAEMGIWRPASREARDASDSSSAFRARILDAACRVAAERGMDGTSVTAVAVEAGVSATTVRHYFQSKEHLFVAASVWVARDLNRQREMIVRSPIDPAQKLGALIQLSRVDVEAGRLEFLIWFDVWGQSMRRRGEFFRDYVERSQTWWLFFIQVLEEGVAQGRFRLEADVDEVANLLVATLNGLLTLSLNARLPSSRANELGLDTAARLVHLSRSDLLPEPLMPTSE